VAYTEEGVRGLEPIPLTYDLRNKRVRTQNASKYGIFNKKDEKYSGEGAQPPGEGAQPPRQTLPQWGGVFPSPRPTPLGACGTLTPPILKFWVRHC